MINQANNLGQFRASYSAAADAVQQSQANQGPGIASQQHQSSRDAELRLEALRLSISSDTSGDTVKRAETYYNFLKGSAA